MMQLIFQIYILIHHIIQKNWAGNVLEVRIIAKRIIKDTVQYVIQKSLWGCEKLSSEIKNIVTLTEDERMKKLTRKQIVTIAVSTIVVVALIITGIVLGRKSNNETKKDTDKKVESVKKEDKKETEKENSKTEETEKADTVVNEDAANNEETTSNSTDSTTAKNETNNNKNNTTNSTTNKTSTTKPSQTVTQPTTSHVHNWTEVKTQVAVPETGHYETIYVQKTVCNACQTDITELTRDERDEHFKKEPCRYGTYTVLRVEAGQKWIVDTPATTEARVTGYKCSCGATREKTQYAGMYSLYDQASWDRLNACKAFFKEGLAGEGSDIEHWAAYGYWESVIVSNGSSDGAWMWIFIRDWKLDDYSYLQDGVKEGIIDQEEAKLVEAVYEEIPSIFKGAIERVAPEGDPDAVPSLAGAKGIIPENIPGLYVTIEETRGGFSLMFWAE